MKFSWKSTAALLLGLTFAFTGVACTDSSDSGSSDSGSDVSSDLGGGSSDSGNSDSSDSGNSGSSDIGNTEIVGADYVNAALLQMTMAQGAEIVFGAEVTQTQGGVTSTANLDGSILLARTADGTNAKLNASVKLGETVVGEAEVYYIDGCVYTYDEEIEAYWCVPVYAPTETVVAFLMEYVYALSDSVSGQIAGALISIAGEQISEAMGQIGGMEFDPTEMLSTLATLIEENGERTEDGGLLLSGEYSVKEELSALVAVINEINEENTTIEEFVDDYVLSAIDPELTLSDLIDVAGEVAALTVSEVYDAVDGYLTENYEMGLQDVWELALATEEVNTLLAQFLDAETIASLSQIELADLLEYQLFERAVGDYTLYELFVMAFASSEDGSDSEAVAPEDPEITETPVVYTNEDSAEEGEEPTVEEQIAALVAYAKEFVSQTTLADIGFYFPAWDNLVITAAKATGEVKFGANYKIVSAKAGVEFGVTGLPVVDATSDISAFAVKIYVGVEEISSVASTIALPADSDTTVMVAIPLEGTGLDGYTAVVLPKVIIENQAARYSFSVMVTNGEGTMYTYSFTAAVVSELPETMIWTNSDDETTIEVTFDFAAGTVDLSELSETVEADFSASETVEDPSSDSEAAWTKSY